MDSQAPRAGASRVRGQTLGGSGYRCRPSAPRWAATLSVALETSHRSVVLAVEDEPLILMLAVDMILDARFEPLRASDAEEAIGILESRDDIKIVLPTLTCRGRWM